jgi:hypothetical protein
MCTGLEIAAVAAAVAGAGTTAYANNQALKQQDEIAAQGILAQGKLQKQGETDVNNTTQTLAQSNAKVQQQSDSQLAAYRAALQQSQGISQSASPDVPGSSKAYKAEQAAAGAGADKYVNAIADSAATTQGTQLERIGEGQAQAATATQLGDLTRQSDEQSYVTKLQIQATQANPWLLALGTTLSAAGAVMGAGAGFSAASAASTGLATTGPAAGALTGAQGLATGATAGGGSIYGQGLATAAAET